MGKAVERGGSRVEEKKRLVQLDILRCMATCLVVLLHVISPYLNDSAHYGERLWTVCNLLSFLCQAGVPLFFMLSGCLLLEDEGTLNCTQFYKKRLRRLLLPFLCWQVLYYIEGCLADGAAPSLLQFVRDLAFRGSKYHLWFFYQIMAIYLLLPFLKRITDAIGRRQLLWLIFIIILPTTLLRFINVVQSVVWISPFSALMENYIAFFLLGLYLRRYPPGRPVRWGVCAAALVFVRIGLWGNRFFSTADKLNLIFNEGYALPQYLTAAALFLLVGELCRRHPPGEGTAHRAEILSGLSFGVYLAHPMALDALHFALGRLGVVLPVPMAWAVSFLFASFATTLGVWVLKKLPLLRHMV